MPTKMPRPASDSFSARSGAAMRSARRAARPRARRARRGRWPAGGSWDRIAEMAPEEPLALAERVHVTVRRPPPRELSPKTWYGPCPPTSNADDARSSSSSMTRASSAIRYSNLGFQDGRHTSTTATCVGVVRAQGSGAPAGEEGHPTGAGRDLLDPADLAISDARPPEPPLRSRCRSGAESFVGRGKRATHPVVFRTQEE